MKNKIINLQTKQIIMAKIEDYLKDTKGNLSSKRLFSNRLLWFFIVFNIVMFPLMIYLDVESTIFMMVLGFDSLVLIGIFAPTQFSKIEEVKEIIALTKPK